MADVLDSLRLLQRLEYLQAELYTRALAATGFVPGTDNPVFDAGFQAWLANPDPAKVEAL